MDDRAKRGRLFLFCRPSISSLCTVLAVLQATRKRARYARPGRRLRAMPTRKHRDGKNPKGLLSLAFDAPAGSIEQERIRGEKPKPVSGRSIAIVYRGQSFF